MLVHLGVLAMASVALDQLALAGDRLRGRIRVLGGPRVGHLALQEVGRVAAPKGCQPTVADLPDAVGDGIEEGAVVRGDQQCAMPSHERLLEPFDGADVEVVGRLVEEDEVGIADDHAGQRGACLLAAAQGGWRLVPLSACEAQPGERLVDPHVEVVAVARLEPFAELGVGGRSDGVGAGRLHLGQAHVPCARRRRRPIGRRGGPSPRS